MCQITALVGTALPVDVDGDADGADDPEIEALPKEEVTLVADLSREDWPAVREPSVVEEAGVQVGGSVGSRVIPSAAQRSSIKNTPAGAEPPLLQDKGRGTTVVNVAVEANDLAGCVAD